MVDALDSSRDTANNTSSHTTPTTSDPAVPRAILTNPEALTNPSAEDEANALRPEPLAVDEGTYKWELDSYNTSKSSRLTTRIFEIKTDLLDDYPPDSEVHKDQSSFSSLLLLTKTFNYITEC